MQLITKTIRIYPELYDKIAKCAAEDLRSINAQMLFILEEYIKEKEKNKKNNKKEIKEAILNK